MPDSMFSPEFEEWIHGKFTDYTSDLPVVITVPNLITLCAAAYILGTETKK
jgi:hypothetical protein